MWLARRLRPQRLGLTRAMIAAATERREAGDWAGACAAAGLELGPQLGATPPAGLEHLVPDLLRWHGLRMRDDETVMRVLGRSPRGDGRPLTMALQPHDGTGGVLALVVERTVPYRCRLVQTPASGAGRPIGLHASPELWDARHAGDLLARCGGTTRLPFFAPDGTPLPPGELGCDTPEGRAERIYTDIMEGRADQAWAAAGIEIAPETPRGGLLLFGTGLPTLLPQARRVGRDAVRLSTPPFGPSLVLDRLATDRPVLRGGAPADAGLPVLPAAAQDWPPVLLDLLIGDLTPDGLHPLVGPALFPALAGPCAPPDLGPPPQDFPVDCGGARHVVGFAGGTLHTPHDRTELDRELTVFALGGPAPAGCFAQYHGWRRADLALDGPLGEYRRRLLHRVRYGEGDTLEAALDAGIDPHCVTERGETLLDLVDGLRPEPVATRLRARLIAAGLR